MALQKELSRSQTMIDSLTQEQQKTTTAHAQQTQQLQQTIAKCVNYVRMRDSFPATTSFTCIAFILSYTCVWL